MLRIMKPILLIIMASLPLLSCHADEKEASSATLAKEYVAGTDYEVLDEPLHTPDPAKIQVLEFFWYGCIHCYHFEPSVQAWQKTIPTDVDFEYVPAIWQPVMELHAKMHYAAEQLGKLDAMHDAFFTAMQVGKMRLASEDEIATLFEQQGIDRQTFSKAFNSFGVDSQVKQAKAKAAGAGITGTPEMVVNGKYRVSSRMTGSQAEMLKVVDFLVKKERKAKK
jgi:thiol:disulfide interchange protein DsbA